MRAPVSDILIPFEVDPEVGATPWTGTAVTVDNGTPRVGTRCRCGNEAVELLYGRPLCRLCIRDKRPRAAAKRLHTMKAKEGRT